MADSDYTNLRRLRAEHFGAMEIDLKDVQFTKELLALVPAEYARRFRVLPVSVSPGSVCLAMSDPSDLAAIEAVGQLLDLEAEICVAHARQLDEFIQRLYGSDHETGD
jgi:type IV pilus assembly protein PilB